MTESAWLVASLTIGTTHMYSMYSMYSMQGQKKDTKVNETKSYDCLARFLISLSFSLAVFSSSSSLKPQGSTAETGPHVCAQVRYVLAWVNMAGGDGAKVKSVVQSEVFCNIK